MNLFLVIPSYFTNMNQLHSVNPELTYGHYQGSHCLAQNKFQDFLQDFPWLQKYFPGPCRSPGNMKYKDKHQLLTLHLRAWQ